jgi:hypothetical protein
MANSFNPLRATSFSGHLAKLKETIKPSVYRTKDGTRLYLAEEGVPNVVLAMFSKDIQSKSDITADTQIAYFLNTSGEEVPVIYNAGEGKEAEFNL